MLAKTNTTPLRVGALYVSMCSCNPAVRDLGVVLDSKLTMKNHIDSVVRIAVSTNFDSCGPSTDH